MKVSRNLQEVDCKKKDFDLKDQDEDASSHKENTQNYSNHKKFK